MSSPLEHFRFLRSLVLALTPHPPTPASSAAPGQHQASFHSLQMCLFQIFHTVESEFSGLLGHFMLFTPHPTNAEIVKNI